MGGVKFIDVMRKLDVTAIVADLERRGLLEDMWNIARYHGVTLEEALSKTKGPGLASFAAARGEMYLFVRERFRWSYPYIGKVFHRDHANVMVTLKRVARKTTGAALDDKEAKRRAEGKPERKRLRGA